MKSMLMTGAMAVALLAGPVLADEYQPTTTTSTTTMTEEKTTVPADQSQGLTDPNTTNGAVIEEHSYTATTTPVQTQPVKKEEKANMRGLTLLLGGGVEGYSGTLAPQIHAGPAWGVRAALKPSKVFGIELGYSGAVNEIGGSGAFAMGPGAGEGADIVRNGGEAVATLGLGAAPVQPYLLGGVGYSWYNVRRGEGDLKDDAVGNVPLGGGLRTHIGNFTADARFGYSFLFDNQFASAPDTEVAGANFTRGGRYNATLNLGSTF